MSGSQIHQGSSAELPAFVTTRARRLRRQQTDAERKLWLALRARQVDGAKFRRQHPIGRYIADFCCSEKNVVIELDGGQHTERVEADQSRTEFLSQQGYRVIRFWDHDILTSLDSVLQVISEALRDPHPYPLPSPVASDGATGPRERVRKSQRGFTIVELMIVVTIAGILVMLAEPSFTGAATKAREAALKQNLFTMRDVIDQFKADRGKYPAALLDLKEVGYLKRIPVDPFTRSDSTWQEILDEADGGVFDVHSGSDLVALGGTPYNQW